MVSFNFRPEIRPFVQSLARLLYYANSRESGKWAYQTSGKGWEECGVFGQAYGTVMAIIREECGEWVALECHNTGFNFGGGRDFLDDIETLIGEVSAPRYLVQIMAGGHQWYAHPKGERIDNEETASRFTKPEAEKLQKIAQESWGSHAHVWIVDTM